MKALLLFAVLANTVYIAYSLCGACSAATNIACVAVDKFQVCSNGVPQPKDIACPNGTVCTADTPICAPIDEVDEPACDECGKCDENKVFACKTYNTFSLCYGTDNSSAVEYTCPGSLMCNNNVPTICIDRVDSGVGSSCPYSTIVTTTTSTTTQPTTIDPKADPDEFCTSKAKRGRYDIPSDPTCTQYINCVQSGDKWYGNTYLCPGGAYFHPNIGICGKDKPPRCTP